MGMDVFGKAPSAAVGEYFRRNVWGWRPLATAITELAPEIAARCTHWQSNDGDGLDSGDAVALADALQAALDDGRVQALIEIRDAMVRALPNETCRLCAGSGKREDTVGVQAGQPTRVCEAVTVVLHVEHPHPRAGQVGWCNGCDGRGWNPNFERNYGLDADDVREFITFARASGGFEIC